MRKEVFIGRWVSANDEVYDFFRERLPDQCRVKGNDWEQEYKNWFFSQPLYFPTPDQQIEWFKSNILFNQFKTDNL